MAVRRRSGAVHPMPHGETSETFTEKTGESNRAAQAEGGHAESCGRVSIYTTAREIGPQVTPRVWTLA